MTIPSGIFCPGFFASPFARPFSRGSYYLLTVCYFSFVIFVLFVAEIPVLESS